MTSPSGLILAFDTTTQQGGVALVDGDGEVRAVRRARVTTHSEMLMGLVTEVLAEAGVKLSSVSAIACAAGPGSFTGLRIGLATAKGLCLGAGRPLVMISSLAALAARAPTGARVFACIDAYKGEVYAGDYRGGVPPTELATERAIVPATLAAELAALVAGGAAVHVVGDAPLRWPELQVAGVIVSDLAPPDPVDVARLAAVRLARGEQDDLATAAPHYLRPSEAEVAAASRAKGAGSGVK